MEMKICSVLLEYQQLWPSGWNPAFVRRKLGQISERARALPLVYNCARIDSLYLGVASHLPTTLKGNKERPHRHSISAVRRVEARP